MEPLDAIPDALDLWSGLYEDYIRRLIEDSDSNLIGRVESFLRICCKDSDIFCLEVAKRHQIEDNMGTRESIKTRGCDIVPYYDSARAIQTWPELCAAKGLLNNISALLAICIHDPVARRPPGGPGILRVQSCLKDLELRSTYNLCLNGLGSQFFQIPPIEVLSSVAEDLLDEVAKLPLQMLNYLGKAYEPNILPYRFDRTQALLQGLGFLHTCSR